MHRSLGGESINASRSRFPGTMDRRIKDPQLRRALERERVRADRSGHDVSLVLFRLTRTRPWRRQASSLVETLRRRARITDDIGPHGRQGAFALLPETEEAGARRFADSVRDLLADAGKLLVYEVFTYHPLPPSRDDDGPRHGRGGDGTGTDRIVIVSEPVGAAALTAVSAVEPDSWDIEPVGAGMHQLFERPTPLWKRLIDVTVAGGVLLAASPLMAAIAVAIKLDSPGPMIFRQRRAGLGGRPFTMFKFRTMCNDAEARKRELMNLNEVDGAAFKLKDDPRITRLGYFLRRMSLDELPQLWNVLRGDMTLVGPRPLPLDESDNCEHWHRARLHVRPGLTCTWQISGRSEIAFNDWMRMDIDYVRNRGLWTDLRILAGTVPAVVARRGAY